MSFKQLYVINKINRPPPSETDVAEYCQEINTHTHIGLMALIQDNLGKPAAEMSNQSGFNEASSSIRLDALPDAQPTVSKTLKTNIYKQTKQNITISAQCRDTVGCMVG